jgi:hypothetical protein
VEASQRNASDYWIEDDGIASYDFGDEDELHDEIQDLTLSVALDDEAQQQIQLPQFVD